MRQFSIAVVGADHLNSDGGNRRSEIAFCDPGEALQLIPEPKNPFDEHAIGVFSARRFQIGYVSSQRAVYLKKLLRDGHDVTAIFQDLAPWGAIARIGIDQSPILPAGQDNTEEDDDIDRDPFVDFDPADNVDVIWPDDPDPDADASYLT